MDICPNGSNAQLWKLEKRNMDSSEIDGQRFRFTTSLDPTKSLSTNQSPSLIISAVGSSFLFTRSSATGCYYVTCKGDYLTGAKNKACMAGWNGSPNQLWEVRKAMDAYILINHATGQALDVQCGSKEEGASMVVQSKRLPSPALEPYSRLRSLMRKTSRFTSRYAP